MQHSMTFFLQAVCLKHQHVSNNAVYRNKMMVRSSLFFKQWNTSYSRWNQMSAKLTAVNNRCLT